jgi:hypothetical protein
MRGEYWPRPASGVGPSCRSRGRGKQGAAGRSGGIVRESARVEGLQHGSISRHPCDAGIFSRRLQSLEQKLRRQGTRATGPNLPSRRSCWARRASLRGERRKPGDHKLRRRAVVGHRHRDPFCEPSGRESGKCGTVWGSLRRNSPHERVSTGPTCPASSAVSATSPC